MAYVSAGILSSERAWAQKGSREYVGARQVSKSESEGESESESEDGAKHATMRCCQ